MVAVFVLQKEAAMKSNRHLYAPAVRPKKKPPLALVIALDIVLTGLALCVFALFHHVLPGEIISTGQTLPRPTTTISTTASGDTATESTATPTTTANGAFGAKFADKFTTGEVIQTADSYQSENINVKITKHVIAGPVVYYVADIYVRDIDYLRSAFADGGYSRNRSDTVLDMATANNAIVAIAGDSYGVRDTGVVIRNGELYRETLYEDVLVMNYDGTMQTFTASQFDIDAVKAKGAWQAWSFGPMLLTDGQPMTAFNSSVILRNPRSAIGYYEPGHYCFVLVDGRQDGYSIGLNMTQLSQLFYDLGCTVAYNFDGGRSAVMTFGGSIANQPYLGGRYISDILYIGE